jgi:hypothetical protein
MYQQQTMLGYELMHSSTQQVTRITDETTSKAANFSPEGKGGLPTSNHCI